MLRVSSARHGMAGRFRRGGSSSKARRIRGATDWDAYNGSHEIRRSPRLPRAARTWRRAQTHRRRSRSATRDDGDLRPRAEERRSRVVVREAEGASYSSAREPLWHTAPRRDGDGRRFHRSAARNRQVAGVSQGTGSAEGPEGRVAEHATGVHASSQYGTQGTLLGAVSGDCLGGSGRRPRAASRSDMLAR